MIQELHSSPPDDLSGHIAEIRGLALAAGGDVPSPTSSIPSTPTLLGFNQRRTSLLTSPAAITPEIRAIDDQTLPFTPARNPTSFSVPPKDYSIYLQRSNTDISTHSLPTRSDSLPGRYSPSVSSTQRLSPLSRSPNSSLISPLTRSETSDGVGLVQPMAASFCAKSSSRPKSQEQFQLPPSAWDEETKCLNKTERLSLLPGVIEEVSQLSLTKSTVAQQQEFERSLSQNAAILCDL